MVTIKNRYFLPLITETLNRLSRAKVFIKLNIIFAFNRFRIREEDKKLIIFYTYFNLFKYLILLFNLYNKSISF